MKHRFLVLWLAGIVSTVLALPYIFALQSEFLAKAAIPLWQVGLVSVAQSALLLAIAVFVGLKLSQKIGLPAPIIFESSIPLRTHLRQMLRLSVPLGVAIAVFIKLADVFFLKYMPALAVAAARIPFWKALLVAPYGGIVEELLLRLFMVSLLAWLLGNIVRTARASDNSAIMWTAIVAAAILFGLGHLPATATITALTPIVIVRAILLNGIGGVVFGWLYWKKGLEYAIVAHFTTDIVLHAVLPTILS